MGAIAMHSHLVVLLQTQLLDSYATRISIAKITLSVRIDLCLFYLPILVLFLLGFGALS
jgi:hypothetical protein